MKDKNKKSKECSSLRDEKRDDTKGRHDLGFPFAMKDFNGIICEI